MVIQEREEKNNLKQLTFFSNAKFSTDVIVGSKFLAQVDKKRLYHHTYFLLDSRLAEKWLKCSINDKE